MSDKWKMFKNYIHNDLGISREDMEKWIEDACKAEGRRIFQQRIKDMNIEYIIKEEVKKFCKDNISNLLVSRIIRKLKVNLEFNE